MLLFRIFSYLLNVGVIAYKYLLLFYNYMISYNKIKLYKNNKKIKFNNFTLKNEDQLIFEFKNKKYSIIKNSYNNNLIDIVNYMFNIHTLKNEIIMSKIILIKSADFDSKYRYSNDELLKFIAMYYGPKNDLYQNMYRIKLKDIKDDRNNKLSINMIKFIDNNFKEQVINGDDFLKN